MSSKCRKITLKLNLPTKRESLDQFNCQASNPKSFIIQVQDSSIIVKHEKASVKPSYTYVNIKHELVCRCNYSKNKIGFRDISNLRFIKKEDSQNAYI